MKTFLDFKSYLTEKLVIVGGGKPYGQIIFLAGGAGSGKSFAIQNFINSHNYKIFDPDAFKTPFLKWNDITKKYPELLGKNQKNPKDATFVHEFLRDKISLEDRILNGLFASITKTDKSILPNIIFDKTFKDVGDINRIVPKLLEAGYKKDDIHLIWVLTDYRIAIQANTSRDRIVPVTLLIQSHGGTAETMKSFLFDNYPSNMINGDAFIILGGEPNTWFFKPTAGTIKTRKMFAGGIDLPKPQVVKKFDYIKVKHAKQAFKPSAAITNIVLRWILDNSPNREEIEKYLAQQKLNAK